jgi:hypothetical protein
MSLLLRFVNPNFTQEFFCVDLWLVFGGVTVLTGISGTAFGGIALDALKRKYGIQNMTSISCALGSSCLYTIIVTLLL